MGVYLIGVDGELDNITVLREILKAFSRPEDDFDWERGRLGHDRRYATDVANLRTELGWELAYTDFAAGLIEIIVWCRDNGPGDSRQRKSLRPGTERGMEPGILCKGVLLWHGRMQTMQSFVHCRDFMYQFCYSAVNQIDNRQIASLILIAGVAFIAVKKCGAASVCRGAWRVVEAAARPVLIIPALSIAIYSAAVMTIAFECSLWSLAISLDVIVEVIVVGIPLVMTSACESRTMRQAIVSMIGPQLKMSAILAAYFGLVIFPLPVELLIQFCFTLLLSVKLLGRGAQGAPCTVVDGFIGFFAIAFACIVAAALISLWTTVDWIAVEQSLALTIWYPFALLPMVIMLAYFSSYQLLWVRLKGCEAFDGLASKLLLSIALFPSLATIARFSQFEAEEIMREKTVAKRIGYICEYRRAIHRRIVQERLKAATLRRHLGKPGFVEGGVWGDGSSVEEIKRGLWTIISLQKGNFARFNRYGENLTEQIKVFTPEECTCDYCLSKDRRQIAVWMTNPTGFTFGLALENGKDCPLAYEGEGGEPPCSVEGFSGFLPYGDVSLVNWNYSFKVDRSYL